MHDAQLASTALIPVGAILAMASGTDDIQSLKDELQNLTDQAEGILARAAEENRDPTDDENAEAEAALDKADAIKARLALKERIAASRTSAGRKAGPEGGKGGDTSRKVFPQAAVDRRTGGFKNIGDFAQTVHAHSTGKGERATQRLFAAQTEGVGEDGGFLVPAEFREGIMKVVEGEDSLLARTDGSTTSRNAVFHPKDETTPWGTTGIQVYWEGEAQSTTASSAKFKGDTLRLNKLFARIDASDEILEDAPQLDNYLRVKTPEVMTSVINLAIIQGNGVGKPLGLLSAPCLVTVAKETSQPADTIFHRNLVKMMGRMYGPCWARSVWLMHQDVWANLHTMSFRDIGAYPSTATTAAAPAFMPPNSLLSGAPFGTLLGRPIVVTQAMETIGDLGDIILADLSKYRTITKSGGMRVDTSIHIKFDTDETAFRFIFRLAGAPWWSAAISQRDGSNTLSPFVTLAERS